MSYCAKEEKEFPKRGTIYYVLDHDTVGKEIDVKEGRPAVITSRNEDNRKLGTVTVAYLTHTNKSFVPTCFHISSGKCFNSWVNCGQITTIDKSLLGDKVNAITDSEYSDLNRCIAIAQGLDFATPKETPEKESPVPDATYKHLYYELLERLIGGNK